MQGYAKPLVFTAALLPFAWLVVLALGNGLGANPAEALIRATGDWTLRFLCLTLAITPLRILTRTPELARFRRMLGLFVYFYASVHLLCYSGFDQGFELGDIATDIAKRPFILVGLLAFAILTALAATSPQRALRWLGAPLGVCCGRAGGAALLLDARWQKQLCRGVVIRRHFGGTAGLAGVAGMAKATCLAGFTIHMHTHAVRQSAGSHCQCRQNHLFR